MLMEYFCVIVCSICVSTVMGLVPSEGEVLFTHVPSKLCIKVGETATFTCNITALKPSPDDINWYTMLHGKPVKIADLKSGNNGRLSITTNWNLRLATLHILNVTLNDTGKYYCGHVNISGNIIVSNMSELIVKKYHTTATEVIDLNYPKETPRYSESQKITVISTSIFLTLLLVLTGITIFLMWYKQRNKPLKTEARNPEQPPQDPTVYSVDYGVLQFGNSQPCKKSEDLYTMDQVEYATIIFPQDNPTMDDHRGRTA